jgi:hypothetical protein
MVVTLTAPHILSTKEPTFQANFFKTNKIRVKMLGEYFLLIFVVLKLNGKNNKLF